MSLPEDALNPGRLNSTLLPAVDASVALQRLPVYLACTVLTLLTNFLLGKDIAWDAVNYHLYAGFSAVNATVSVDAGVAPASGGGIEVRLHDYGWGVANDRNLLGRFSTQTFSLARLARTQTYFMRLYDNSSPPRYSRYAAALHVDYPL